MYVGLLSGHKRLKFQARAIDSMDKHAYLQ